MSGSGAFSPNQYDNHGMSFFGGFECFWQIRGGSSFHEPKTWQVSEMARKVTLPETTRKGVFPFQKGDFQASC